MDRQELFACNCLIDSTKLKPALHLHIMKKLSLSAWLFVAFLVVASINHPPEMPKDIAYPLWAPLEMIRNWNRWICLCLLGGVIVLAASAGLPKKGMGLVFALGSYHMLVLGKNLFSLGLSAFPIAAGFVAMALAILYLSRSVTGPGTTPASAWQLLVIGIAIFISLTLLQYFVNPVAMYQNKRFAGLTANPQMFALVLGIVTPILVYEYSSNKRILPRFVVMALGLVLLFFVTASGSRLGLLLVLFSLSVYYRQQLHKLMAFVVPLVIIVLAVGYVRGVAVQDVAEMRMISTEDTRLEVWLLMIDEIAQNPLIGRPLGAGERVGTGESTFLAAWAGTGILGAMAALTAIVLMARHLLHLMALERVTGWEPELALPISILATFLVGTFVEASLLGVFTTPLTAVLYVYFVSNNLLARVGSGRPRSGVPMAGGRGARLRRIANRLLTPSPRSVPRHGTDQANMYKKDPQ